MGFFTKTREKGLKSVTKEKNKKSNSKATDAKKVVPLVNEIKNTIEEQDKKRAKPSNDTPIQPTVATNNASSNTMPWWVSDASFTVEGKKISAHKVVISSKSKILAQLIESSPSGAVEINNHTHNIFSQLIKWIYGGRFEISAEDATQLRVCALEFEIQDLAESCQAVEEANHTKPIIVTYNLKESLDSIESSEPTSASQETPYEDILYENQDYSNPLEAILPTQDYGMTLYSDDPILFNPDPQDVDEFRLMEIY